MLFSCTVHIAKSNAYYITNVKDKTVIQLRWDHADLSKYYNMTFLHLQPVLDELFDLHSIVDSESSNKEIISIDESLIFMIKLVMHLKSLRQLRCQFIERIFTNSDGPKLLKGTLA